MDSKEKNQTKKPDMKKNNDGNEIHSENEILIEREENNKEETIKENVKSKEEEEIIFLQKKNEEYEKEINEIKDRLLRKAAEFENYKRRNENDQLNLIKYAAESFIVKLLPTIDDLERSMKHLQDVKEIESLKTGFKLIYDNLLKVIEDQGIKKIEALNQPFDVTYHEALMQRNVPGIPPHTVVEEIETGYLYKDRVIRHAKVVVSDDNGNISTNSSKDSNTSNEENGIKEVNE